MNRFLAKERLTASHVWQEVRSDIQPSQNGYVVFDDTVLDKSHSRKIDSVRWQYSGNEHKVIRGIAVSRQLRCLVVLPHKKITLL